MTIRPITHANGNPSQWRCTIGKVRLRDGAEPEASSALARSLDMVRALGINLVEVVVIGVDEDGFYYFDSSHSEPMVALWMIEKFKRSLIRSDGEGEVDPPSAA